MIIRLCVCLLSLVSLGGIPYAKAAANSSQNISLNAQQVYQKVNKSIFTIYGVNIEKNGTSAQGSAVAVKKDVLATNCHVALARNFIVVRVNDKDRIGTLLYQKGDLCLVEVTDANFPFVNIRPSKDVQIGEEVFAIGNPEGYEKTISKGIVSNKYQNEQGIILQTDAAISHGSSGGGLFDNGGNLIGLTTAMDRNGENIGFVIPTELILKIFPQKDFAKTAQQDEQEVTEQLPARNPETKNANLIGYYGKSKIGLFRWNNKCIIAITGRYRNDQPTSLAVWFPSNPNGFFIFPQIIAINDAVTLMNKMYQIKKPQYIVSKSFLFLEKQLYGLSLISQNKTIFPIYVFAGKNDLTETLVIADYFLGQIYHFQDQAGLTTIKFELDGFTAALAASNKYCNENT